MKTLWVREYMRDLLEAAFPLDVSKRRLRDLQMPISEHLFKFFFLPADPAVKHWRGELQGWSATLGRLNNTKTKSGRAYSRELLHTVLWDEPFGTDEDLRTMARLWELPEREVTSRRADFKRFVDGYIAAIYGRERWQAP